MVQLTSLKNVFYFVGPNYSCIYIYIHTATKYLFEFEFQPYFFYQCATSRSRTYLYPTISLTQRSSLMKQRCSRSMNIHAASRLGRWPAVRKKNGQNNSSKSGAPCACAVHRLRYAEHCRPYRCADQYITACCGMSYLCGSHYMSENVLDRRDRLRYAFVLEFSTP